MFKNIYTNHTMKLNLVPCTYLGMHFSRDSSDSKKNVNITSNARHLPHRPSSIIILREMGTNNEKIKMYIKSINLQEDFKNIQQTHSDQQFVFV